MPKVIYIPNCPLGNVVELRELTVGQWLEVQSTPHSDNEAGLAFLARMLYIDGEPVGWDRLQGFGMSSVSPLLGKVGEILNSGSGEGNG